MARVRLDDGSYLAQLRITTAQHDLLEEVCRVTGVARSEVIRAAIDYYQPVLRALMAKQATDRATRQCLGVRKPWTAMSVVARGRLASEGGQ